MLSSDFATVFFSEQIYQFMGYKLCHTYCLHKLFWQESIYLLTNINLNI